MKDRGIHVFFYGSFMEPKVLARFRAFPRNLQPARLSGWRIGFTPFATILPRRGSLVWGVVGTATPRELERVYGQALFPEKGAGHRYFPEAVVVSARGGRRIPALVYVSTKRGSRRPSPEYVEILLKVSRRRRFPRAYIRELETFGGVCTLRIVEGADHDFRVLKSSGRTRAEVLTEIANAIVVWERATFP